MVNEAPQFETKDDLGTTEPFVGNVGVSPINVPAVAGSAIAECFIRCDGDNVVTRRLLYSVDGGVTFQKLAPGEYVGWILKGGITQIVLKAQASTVDYEVILNREP